MFRQEVVQRIGRPRHGQILLARPISHASLGWLLVAIVAAICIFLCTATFSKKGYAERLNFAGEWTGEIGCGAIRLR